MHGDKVEHGSWGGSTERGLMCPGKTPPGVLDTWEVEIQACFFLGWGGGVKKGVDFKRLVSYQEGVFMCCVTRK